MSRPKKTKQLFSVKSLFGYGYTSTIGSSLVLLVIFCVLPGSLISAFLIFDTYRLEKNRLTRDAITTARAMAATLDKDLASLESSLRVLAISRSLASRDFANFYLDAKKALLFQNANTYVLLDSSGSQQMNTLLPFGAPLPATGVPPQLQRIFETDATVLTDVFTGAVTGKPILAMGVPVHGDGKIVYSLNAGIFPERMAALLQRQRLPAGWISAILDGSGTLIARSHEMENFVGKKAVPMLVNAARLAPEGSLETVTLEGIPVITVFSRSTVSSWAVAIGIPKATLEAELRKSFWLLIVATTALLLGGLWLASRLGVRIVWAINGLTGPALALGSGAEVNVPPLHLKEADDVGQALVLASRLLQQTRKKAYHDVLTGLANRALFMEVLNQQVMLCERGNLELAVLYLDLDGFKSVNDEHGHATGDELLQAAASRIKGAIRTADIAARLGGDEFAVLLLHSDIKNAQVVAAKLVELLSAPYQLHQVNAHVSASIGVAMYPSSAESASALLTRADEAMYMAKKSGKSCYVIATKTS